MKDSESLSVSPDSCPVLPPAVSGCCHLQPPCPLSSSLIAGPEIMNCI